MIIIDLYSNYLQRSGELQPKKKSVAAIIRSKLRCFIINALQNKIYYFFTDFLQDGIIY